MMTPSVRTATLFALAVLTAACMPVGYPSSQQWHYDHFENPPEFAETPPIGFFGMLRWSWNAPPGSTDADFHPPIQVNSGEAVRQNHQQDSINWIGHSTFLLQIAGQNILTDPIFFSLPLV